MTAPTPESVELAKKRLAQAKARLDALNARIATEGRRLDTRSKLILGGLLLDAATKYQRFAGIVSELTHRTRRDPDRHSFERDRNSVREGKHGAVRAALGVSRCLHT